MYLYSFYVFYVSFLLRNIFPYLLKPNLNILKLHMGKLQGQQLESNLFLLRFFYISISTESSTVW